MRRRREIVFRERLDRRQSWRLLFAWARHMTYLFVDFCRMPRLRGDAFEGCVDARAFQLGNDLLHRRRVGGQRFARSGAVGGDARRDTRLIRPVEMDRIARSFSEIIGSARD